MAKRYSGNLQISVVYDDKNHYRTAVSRGGKLLWRGIVNPAPAGFGPGVAYDSPKAYDEIASSALSFADHEVGGIGDEAEYDENLTGYLIRRSPRAKMASAHAKRSRDMTKKPWEKPRPVGAPKTKLTPELIAVARALAAKANRPYPNLVDNMAAVRLAKAGLGRPAEAPPTPTAPTSSTLKKSAKRSISVRKVGARWQPVDKNGRVVRGSVYNADGTGYSTKAGAVEAAAMLRQLGDRG
jgi:hypothetical protein